MLLRTWRYSGEEVTGVITIKRPTLEPFRIYQVTNMSPSEIRPVVYDWGVTSPATCEVLFSYDTIEHVS